MAKPRPRSGDGMVALHSLQRSLSALTIGVIRDDHANRERSKDIALAETEEQFQVEVSGVAGPVLEWQVTDLDFTQAFYALEGERNNPVTEPQMWFGSMIESPTPVVFSVCVMGWNLREDDAFVGATVAIGAFSPDDDHEFRGRVHITFQGYGAPQDNSAGEP